MNPLSSHYGFSHPPFGRHVPDGGLLEHRGFREARMRLQFTAELDGMAAFVAEPGCGKSLLLGTLADALQRDGWAV